MGLTTLTAILQKVRYYLHRGGHEKTSSGRSHCCSDHSTGRDPASGISAVMGSARTATGDGRKRSWMTSAVSDS